MRLWLPTILLLATVPYSVAAPAGSPPLLWSRADRIQILCNVVGGPGVDHVRLTAELCATMRSAVAGSAPVEVSIIGFGDPAVLAPSRVTLLVHGSVSQSPSGRLLAFSIRPHRNDADAGAVMFGAAPRAVPLPRDAIEGPAFDAALKQSLDELLPWRTPTAARPLN